MATTQVSSQTITSQKISTDDAPSEGGRTMSTESRQPEISTIAGSPAPQAQETRVEVQPEQDEASPTRRGISGSLGDKMGQSLHQLYTLASCLGQRAGAVAATSGAVANEAATAVAMAAMAATTSGSEPIDLVAPVAGFADATRLNHLHRQPPTPTPPPPAYHNIPGTVPFYRGRSAGPPPSYDDVVNPFAAPPSYQSLFGQMREARKSSRGMLDLTWRLISILVSRLVHILAGLFVIMVTLLPFAMIIIGATYIDDCRVEHIPAFLLVGGVVGAAWIIINIRTQFQEESHNLHGSLHRSMTGDATNGRDAANEEDRFEVELAMTLASMPEISTGDNNSTLPQQQSLIIDLNSQRQQQSPASINRCDVQQSDELGTAPSTGAARSTSRLKSSVCASLLFFALVGWFIAGCIIVFRNYEPDFYNQNSARYCNRTVYMFTFWLITSGLMILSTTVCTIIVCCVKPAVATRHNYGDDEYYVRNNSNSNTSGQANNELAQR